MKIAVTCDNQIHLLDPPPLDGDEGGVGVIVCSLSSDVINFESESFTSVEDGVCRDQWPCSEATSLRERGTVDDVVCAARRVITGVGMGEGAGITSVFAWALDVESGVNWDDA